MFMWLTPAKAAARAALLAALLVVVAVPLAAQATGTLRGKVVEAGSQRPLNGVQVVVDGTTRGGVTNSAGEYTIASVPAGSHTVRASMVGFSPSAQTVTVGASAAATLNFTLSSSAISLDALVVTGTPGAATKRTLGNAVASVNVEEIADKAPVTNVTQVLQGRTPGLTIMQPAGTAGAASNFRIRGAGSISAGNHPVFIIDGVRMQSGSQGGFSVSGQETSALNAINPDDIESIEVIKGPAAATLYGAEAAAGVIQIITKKGKVGRQATEYNAKIEMGNTHWHTPIRDNYTTCTAARIAGSSGTGASAFIGCAGKQPGDIITDNPLKQPGILRDGSLRNYNLSVRGGGERYSFFISGDKSDEQGVFINNYFDRSSARGNFVVHPTDKIDVTTSVQISRTHTRLPNNDNSSNGWLRNAYRGLPGQRGTFAVGWRGLGPEEMAIYNNQERAERFIGGMTLNYRPTSWFKNRVVVGLDAGNRLHTLFYPIDRTGKLPYSSGNGLGYISQYAPATRRYSIDYGGTMTKDFSEALSSSLSFGANLNMYHFESLQATGEGLISDKVRTVSTANITRGYEDFSEQNSLGFYAQEQIGWENRIFVTGAVRVDNNSAFGENFHTVLYPKLSGAWVISEESFFNLPHVDNLRLRAAWGQAGNAPSPFSADRTYSAYTMVQADNSLAPALRASAYGNPNLRAERGSEIEVGFESALFNNRAGLEFTFYNKDTHDALVSVNAAPSTGFGGSPLQNVGHINNKGIEVALFGTPVVKPNLTWDTRVGLSTNKNELVSWGGVRDTYIGVGYRSSQRHDVGYPLGGYWAETIERNPDGSLKLSAGRPVLGEFYYVGSSTPTREASWTNTFTVFKNLQLYAFADYKGGHYLLNMTEGTRAGDGNSWVMNDPNASEEDRLLAQWGGNAPFLEHADFIKLREVSATYTVPRSLVRHTGADRLSLTLAARNLFTWTKYSQPDPEVNIEGPATFTRGDSNSVPALRQLVATLNVRF